MVLLGILNFHLAQLNFFVMIIIIDLILAYQKKNIFPTGNKLGIIDRLVRALRELIEKYFDITGNKKR